MTKDDWKTLRVPADKYQEAKAQKEEHGRTWGQQIVRGDSDNPTTMDDEIQQELEKLKGLVERVPEQTAEQLERYR